ncbi:hypothetical protein DOTSEDRAFT_76693 [Dothistroma septosporum NZE10]|uniref:Clr5 domain-containing protein n=1 Tax=Dothistroma septosporum (strain NZE10 / CBS 128990) TaxID=675120 RepID=N1Q110_DOTSN|nr:hypothetical protein DOTSEDRAFT_76693 [Dothistroma septosporum NZE10]
MPARTQETSIDQHRAEIERLTQDGASCEQVAAVLKAAGFTISAKSISRYRVAWGLRKRQASTKGRTYPHRKRTVASQDTPSKTKSQEARKAEITRLTREGKTPEEIVEALEAQGIHFKNAVSTIWRLQTSWGLIEPDKHRSRGTGPYKKKKSATQAKEAGLGPASKKRKEILAPSNPGEILHYPTNLQHGPSKRGEQPHAQHGDDMDASYNIGSNPSPYPALDNRMQMSNPSEVPSVNVAAELMATELLIDLANSTLSAAHRVKELYLAQQALRPGPGMSAVPTNDDVATAKRKVRESAAVMHDMAMPNIVES